MVLVCHIIWFIRCGYDSVWRDEHEIETINDRKFWHSVFDTHLFSMFWIEYLFELLELLNTTLKSCVSELFCWEYDKNTLSRWKRTAANMQGCHPKNIYIAKIWNKM